MTLPVNMSRKEHISHAMSICVSRVATTALERLLFLPKAEYRYFQKNNEKNRPRGQYFRRVITSGGKTCYSVLTQKTVNTKKISRALLCCNSWESAINVHMHQTILDQIFDLEEVTKPIVPSVFISIHFRILFTFLCGNT